MILNQKSEKQLVIMELVRLKIFLQGLQDPEGTDKDHLI